MIILKSKIYVGLGSFRPEMNHLSTLHVIKHVQGGGLYKRWDQKFYSSKTMIFVSIMMVAHK